MARDYAAVFAHIEAAEPFKVGAKVKHKDDIGTDKEGQVYEITVEHGYSKMWLDPYRVCSYEDLILVSEAVSQFDKLTSTFEDLKVNKEATVSLTYSDSEEVLHYKGEAEETAVNHTTTVENLVEIARSGIKFQDDLISDMRDQDHLEDYERGDFDFDSYCRDMIADNFYDYDGYIECSTEQYDHKRGKTTVTASLTTTVGDLLSDEDSINGCNLTGWKAEFSTNNGSMTIELQ